MAGDSPKVFISAGEASADLHGSRLARALVALDPSVRIACMGGRLLREAGAEVLVDNRELAVVGVTEVLRHARAIYEGWRRLRFHIVNERPDIVILIDFPDFNFLLARLAKRHDLKIFYYISPQVWAWRSGRVKTLRRLVDRMAVILPFETDFYARHSMKVDFVGHPLLDVLSDAPSVEASRLRYRDGAPLLVGLLPGSRGGEIRMLLDTLLQSAAILKDRVPEVSFILPVAPTVDAASIEAVAKRAGVPVRVVSGDTYGVIRACDLIVSASGTVTLEAAILNTPMVVIYRVSELSYRIGRRLVRVSHFALPNLIAGDRIVPELLQEEANPLRIAFEAECLLRNPDLLIEQRRRLAGLASRLGGPGVADRAARIAFEVMGR